MAKKQKDKKTKKKLSLMDRILTIISVILIVASVGSIGYVAVMNWQPLSELDQEGNAASIDDDIQNDVNIKKKVTNFLVTGIDYAEGTGRAKLTGCYSEKSGKTYDAVAVLDDTGGQYVNFKLEFPDRK